MAFRTHGARVGGLEKGRKGIFWTGDTCEVNWHFELCPDCCGVDIKSVIGNLKGLE